MARDEFKSIRTSLGKLIADLEHVTCMRNHEQVEVLVNDIPVLVGKKQARLIIEGKIKAFRAIAPDVGEEPKVKRRISKARSRTGALANKVRWAMPGAKERASASCRERLSRSTEKSQASKSLPGYREKHIAATMDGMAKNQDTIDKVNRRNIGRALESIARATADPKRMFSRGTGNKKTKVSARRAIELSQQKITQMLEQSPSLTYLVDHALPRA